MHTTSHTPDRGRLRTIFSRLATNRRERRNARELHRVLTSAPPWVRYELALMAQRDNVPFVR